MFGERFRTGFVTCLRIIKSTVAIVFVGAVFSNVGLAANTITDALQNGTPIVDLRYRFEIVDQDGFARNANASTLRSRVGYQTDAFKGFSGLIEFENITNLGNGRYNSTTNGKNLLPVVADPDATEVNRAQLSYTASKTTLTAGRQRLILDDARFVGNVGFRQNEQTFDSLHLSSQDIEGLSASYTYIFKVHRIFGDDHPAGNFKGDTHLFNASYDQLPIGKVTTYAYFVDLEQAPALSSKTFGARVTGTQALSDGLSFSYIAAFAHQTDYQANPFDVSLDYYALEAGLSVGQFNLRGGIESLEGNGVRGFATPLATLHKFQGFADAFLTTPANGIEDAYLSVDTTYKTGREVFQSLKIAAWYHDYASESGPGGLGDEINLLVSAKMLDWLSLEIKYADYSSPTALGSREKLWFTVGAKF